jgi:hypothetical protein
MVKLVICQNGQQIISRREGGEDLNRCSRSDCSQQHSQQEWKGFRNLYLVEAYWTWILQLFYVDISDALFNSVKPPESVRYSSMIVNQVKVRVAPANIQNWTFKRARLQAVVRCLTILVDQATDSQRSKYSSRELVERCS